MNRLALMPAPGDHCSGSTYDASGNRTDQTAIEKASDPGKWRRLLAPQFPNTAPRWGRAGKCYGGSNARLSVVYSRGAWRLAGLLLLASLPGITFAWYALIFFTLLLAAGLTKMYWRHRGKRTIWRLLFAFIAIHIVAYVVLLHYVPNWPAFWFIVTVPAEVMLFIFVAHAWLHVLPTAKF